MKNVIYIYKPVGLTPLEAIVKFKEKYSEYKRETISYAGRLDPMAEGILILLIGEENKNREKYLGLDKTYESEILFGISTDTYDGLGKIINAKNINLNDEEIKKAVEKFIGKRKQKYPPYSSKAVKGKPLYWWARDNKLGEIEIPDREIEIFSIKFLESKKLSGSVIAEEIIKKINYLNGDFRQEEIISDWNRFKKEFGDNKFSLLKIEVSCSTGTYIRRLASDIGDVLEIGAIAYTINRTRIGDITQEKSLSIF